MGRAMRYQEILRRLAVIDEGFVGDRAGIVLGPPGVRGLDPKTAALVRVGVLVAIGAPEVCLEWSSSQALTVVASSFFWLTFAVAFLAGGFGSSEGLHPNTTQHERSTANQRIPIPLFVPSNYLPKARSHTSGGSGPLLPLACHPAACPPGTTKASPISFRRLTA